MLASQVKPRPAIRRVTAAGSDERQNVRLAFVNSTHRLIVRRVLAPFLEAVAPETLKRFESPELIPRPNLKRGTQEYCANTSLMDYDLSVTLIDGDPMTLTVSLTIRNPHSEKRTVVLDSSVVEDLDSAFLTEKAKGAAVKVANKVVREVRAQVQADLPTLKAQLQVADGQVRFLRSLMSAFQAMEK